MRQRDDARDATMAKVGRRPQAAGAGAERLAAGREAPSRDEPPRFRLLIVEDDDLIAELLGEALKEHFAVHCVPTGARARSVLLAGGVDVLLSDYRLPDGPAAPILHEADRLGVPVLVMTGDPDALEGAAHRDRPLLAKPFGTVELLLALERVLDASGCLGRSGRACHPNPFRSGPRFVIEREERGGCAL